MRERYRVHTGRVEEARTRAFRFLDAHRRADSSWVGEMSSSALATAISCLALRLQPEIPESSIRSGLNWLAETQQTDGGWGDGVIDESNMNATSLTASVLQYCDAGTYSGAIRDALRWVERAGGFKALNDPRVVSLSGPCRSVYALAGFVDWGRVRKLPTEMILLPRRIRRTVSTTFPAFLSLSLMHERFSPVPWWRRPLRRRAAREALAWLRQAQGPNGSYEESAFLTSLIVVALTTANAGAGDIIQQALPFIRASQRADGSWPIDRDLENFDTAQAIFAHHEAGRPISGSEQDLREWFLKNQFRAPFFATSAPPGGWAWAYPAGWPDVDDTAYALRALRILGVPPEHEAIRLGVRWLYQMQNRDGSWPTFVRGSKMPFDHDCPYITSHVLSALATMDPGVRRDRPVQDALSYLRRHQNEDGSFDSLWFRMHTCGTAAAIEAFADLQLEDTPMAHRASEWLRTHQNADGGWGDGRGADSTAEETAWAAGALLRLKNPDNEAVGRGIEWLLDHQRADGGWNAAVIGLYYKALAYSNTFYALSHPLVALSRYSEE